jgi:MoxR-like ATPase
MHLPYDAQQAQTPHALLCDRLPLTAACIEAAPLHHDAVAADIGLQDDLLLSSLPHTLPERRAKHSTAAPSWLTAAQCCWSGFSVHVSKDLQVAQNYARLAFWLFGAAIKPPRDAAAAADLEAASHLLSLPLNELTSTLLLAWLAGADHAPPSLKGVQFLSLPSLARAADRQWPFVRLVRSSAATAAPAEEQLAFLRCAEQAGRAVGGSFSLAAVQALVAAVEGMFGAGVVDSATAAEPDFVLSPHVLLRLLVLGMHFALGLPLVLEGETGVGKTKLLQVFFHCFVLHGRTSDAGQLKQINVHPGLEEDIVARLLAESLEGCTTAKPSGPEATPTWISPPNVLLFVDEINCAPVSVMETLRSLVMDRHFTTESGVRQRLTARVWVAAACNPAGVSRRALYYVQPMPPSLERVRWPLDSLAMDDVGYIAAVRLFRWLALCLLAPNYISSQFVPVMCAGDEEEEVGALLGMVLAAHRAADAFGSRQRRAGELGAPAVSLRDLDRALELATTMLDSMLQLPSTPFWPERAEMLGARPAQAPAMRERAIGLGVAMAFMLRMPRSRRQPEASRSGSPRLVDALQWMDLAAASLVQLLKLQERQAALPFDGLNETLLALFVYTSARIPLFIIGEPGTSKSLSLSLLAQALLDDTLREGSRFLQAAPKPNMTVVQCSPELTAGLLKADFARARRWIESGEVPLLVLEEAGPAIIDAPAVTDLLPAIKALHDEVDRELQKPKARRVVLISISNTYFDAAKMNRGGVLLREGLHESDRVELALTSLRRAAERVSSAFTEAVAVETMEAIITELAHNLAKPIYHALVASVRCTPLAATFGHRDYFAILQTVIHTAHSATAGANDSLSCTPSQHSLSHSVGPAVEDSVEDMAGDLRLGLRQNVAMAVLHVADGVHAARTQVIDTMRQLWGKDGLPLAITQKSSLPEGARAGQLLQRAIMSPTLWTTSGDKSETAWGSDARQSSSSATDVHDGSESGKRHRDGGGGDIVYLDRPTLCVSTLAPQAWWLQLVSDTDHVQQTLQGAESIQLPIQLPFLHNLHTPDADADAILSLLAPALGLGGPIVVGAGPATLNSLLDVINGHAISSDAVTGHRQSRIAKRGLSIYQSIHPSSRLIFMVDGATLPSWPCPVTQRLFKVNLNVAAFASHIFHVVWTRGGKDSDYEGKPSLVWLNAIREELKRAGATGICFADEDVLVLAMSAEVIQAPDRQPWSCQYGPLQAFRQVMSDHLRHFALAPDSVGSCLRAAARVGGHEPADGATRHNAHSPNVLHRVMKRFDSAMATAARLEALLTAPAQTCDAGRVTQLDSALDELRATQLGVDGAAVSGFGPAEVESVLFHLVGKLAQLQYSLLAVELDGSRYSIEQLSRIMTLLTSCQQNNAWCGQVHMVIYSPLDVDDPFEGPLHLVPGWRVHACSGLASPAPMKHHGASVSDAGSVRTRLGEAEKRSVRLALELQLHGFRCLHGLVSLARRHVRADGVELVCWQSPTLSPTLIQLLSSVAQTETTAAAEVVHTSVAQDSVSIPLATLQAYAAAAGAARSPLQSASLLTDGAASSSRGPAVAFMSAALPQATANMARIWLEEQYPRCRIQLRAAGRENIETQASFVELRPPQACPPEDEKAMALAVRELRLSYCRFSFTEAQVQVLDSDNILRRRCAIMAFGALYTEAARCDLPALVRFWCEHHYASVTPLCSSKGWRLECLSQTLQTQALAGLKTLAELVTVKSCEHSLSKLVAAAVVKDSRCPAARHEQFAAAALTCVRQAFSAVLGGQPAIATVTDEPWSEMVTDARLLLPPTDMDTKNSTSGGDVGRVNSGTGPGDNGGDGSAQGFAAPQTKVQQPGVLPTFRARVTAPESNDACAIELTAMAIDMKHAEKKLREAVSTAVARVRLWLVSVHPGALANNDRAEGVAVWCDIRPSGRSLIARKQEDPGFTRQVFAQAEACAGLVAADRHEEAERLAVSHGLSYELVDDVKYEPSTIVVKVKSSNHTAIFTVLEVDDDVSAGAEAAGAAEAPAELDEQHVWLVATEHGAQIQLQHWAIATCPLCLRDDVPITEGLWCGGSSNVAGLPMGEELPASRHFHCKGCLPRMIKEAIAPENTVRGIHYTCGGCDFRFELRMLSPQISLDMYQRAAAAERKHQDDAIAKKYQEQLERDLKQRLDEELKRMCLMDERQRKVLQHRRFVWEKLFMDHCPRCSVPIGYDEGCIAMTCKCGCGFCGYCLSDCGTDAHGHVLGCRYVAEQGLFGNFYRGQAQRRTKRLAEYLRSITDKTDHNNLLTQLEKDVEGMDVNLPPRR